MRSDLCPILSPHEVGTSLMSFHTIVHFYISRYTSSYPNRKSSIPQSQHPQPNPHDHGCRHHRGPRAHCVTGRVAQQISILDALSLVEFPVSREVHCAAQVVHCAPASRREQDSRGAGNELWAPPRCSASRVLGGTFTVTAETRSLAGKSLLYIWSPLHSRLCWRVVGRG